MGSLNPIWLVSYKKALGNKHRPRENYVKTKRKNSHLKAKERILRMKLTPPTAWSQTSSFQNCETINFCCLSHLICVFCYNSSSKLTHYETTSLIWKLVSKESSHYSILPMWSVIYNNQIVDKGKFFFVFRKELTANRARRNNRTRISICNT